jgi:cell division protein FtsN
LLKDNCWSIQVGAFEGKEKAYQTALKALNILGMADKQIETPQANERFYRSRIQGFQNKMEANNACQKLQGSRWQCFAISP